MSVYRFLKHVFGKAPSQRIERDKMVDTLYTIQIFGIRLYPIVRDFMMKYGFRIKNPSLLRLNLYSNISNTKNHLEIGPADMDHFIQVINDKNNCKILLIDITDAPMQVGKLQLIENGFKQKNINCLNTNIIKNDKLIINKQIKK